MSENTEQVGQFPDEPQDIHNKKSKSKILITVAVLIVLTIITFGVFYFTNIDNNQSRQNTKTPPADFIIGGKGPNNIPTNIGINTTTTTTTTPTPAIHDNTQIINKIDGLVLLIEQKLLNIKNNNTNNINDSLKNIKATTSIIKQELGLLQQNNNKLKQIENLINEGNINLHKELQQLKKSKTNSINTKHPFNLLSIDIWDNSPQATISIGSKQTIVDIGDKRLGWKVLEINFDKEYIKIIKNSKELILEIIK
jgi:hypothetical protein